MDTARYVGIDIGGTKISAALVDPSGKILCREKVPTEKDASGNKLVSTLVSLINKLLSQKGVKPKYLKGIGIAVPGIVDPSSGRVLKTPNMGLSGTNLVKKISKATGVAVKIGNDANLGTLAECWKGAAQGSQEVVGVFVGTGVGAGVVAHGALLTGFHGAAAEIGHMTVDSRGPRCSCGNKGCLEALCGRWAIERDIRAALKKGKRSVITKIAGKKAAVFKSKMLKAALEKRDRVVSRVFADASLALAGACASLRRIFDPEVIVLGGGVVEACGGYILPQVKKQLSRDPFFSVFKQCTVAQSSLGDDAVLLGAVALFLYARPSAGVPGQYPFVESPEFGVITVDGAQFEKDIIIHADGRVEKRDKKRVKELFGTSHKVSSEELRQVCSPKPEFLVIASGQEGMLSLTRDAERFLSQEKIAYELLPTPQAAASYNDSIRRKALLAHVTC